MTIAEHPEIREARLSERELEPQPEAVVGPTTRRLEELPKELGVLLASVGVLGLVLPGIAGAPALIAGGLVLWPRTFGKVERWFSDRFPSTHRVSMRQVGRFLDDLEYRYPEPENTRT
jgi:hypothetical protein